MVEVLSPGIYLFRQFPCEEALKEAQTRNRQPINNTATASHQPAQPTLRNPGPSQSQIGIRRHLRRTKMNVS